MSKVVKVEAKVDLYITVPNDATDDDVYSFLVENISYRDAFLGVSDDTMRVTEVMCLTEKIFEMGDLV
jgi:hypothetical protein